MPKRIRLRPEVRKFAEAMELKLRKHDEDYSGWGDLTSGSLYTKARQELTELANAILSYNGDNGSWNTILEEAADVANFLMMICDNYGLLKEVE